MKTDPRLALHQFVVETVAFLTLNFFLRFVAALQSAFASAPSQQRTPNLPPRGALPAE
jgi:hypothetical protein